MSNRRIVQSGQANKSVSDKSTSQMSAAQAAVDAVDEEDNGLDEEEDTEEEEEDEDDDGLSAKPEETKSKQKGKQGRKVKEGPDGRRDRFKLHHACFYAEFSGSEKEFAQYKELCKKVVFKSEMIAGDTPEASAKAFEASHRDVPLAVSAPLYVAKGTAKTDKKDLSSHSIQVEISNVIRHTQTVFQGELHGWLVFGNGLVGFQHKDGTKYADNELIKPYIKECLVKGDNDDKKPRKPGIKPNEVIRVSDLQNVVIL